MKQTTIRTTDEDGNEVIVKKFNKILDKTSLDGPGSELGLSSYRTSNNEDCEKISATQLKVVTTGAILTIQ